MIAAISSWIHEGRSDVLAGCRLRVATVLQD
jgi:hypothetical protein